MIMFLFYVSNPIRIPSIKDGIIRELETQSVS